MIKMIKKLPPVKTLLAIIFLVIQISSMLYLPYITAGIVNNGVATGNTTYIWTQGAVMVGVSVIGLVGAVLNTMLFTKVSCDLGGELRWSVYRKALCFSKAEFDKFGASSLITRNTNDVTQVQTLVETGLKFLLMAPIQLFGGIFMTWLLSPVLGLVFVAAVPLLAVAYIIIYKFANPLYSKMQTLIDKLNLIFKEGLTGVKVIRAFNKEDMEFQKYDETNREYEKVSIFASTIMGFFIPALSMLLSIAALLIIWIGASRVAAGNMEVGTIIGAISYGAQILSGFALLTNVIMMIPRGQISAKRVNEILEQPLAIQDPQTAGSIAAVEKSLTFEDVDFSYQNANKKALSGISFKVYGGQTLAVIGSTGDGKSSLVNLISRLYDVEKGHIRLNGADVRDFPQKLLHERVSHSPQVSTLFFGTIRSNMLVGKPDATDEEIWAALDMAHATEFVKALDKGLDSTVEKAGGNFSGGQKQRLCIARVLLKNADVYIFDDSFSALDFKTDAAVRSAMRGKIADAITVIVAQRISTVMNADLIAVLEHGMLVGLGTHEELKENNSVYQQIIGSQTYKEVA